MEMLGHQAVQVLQLARHLHRAGVQPGDVQQCVQLRGQGLVDIGQQLRDLLPALVQRAHAQCRHQHVHAVDGLAQVMAGGGQEVGLGPVRLALVLQRALQLSVELLLGKADPARILEHRGLLFGHAHQEGQVDEDQHAQAPVDGGLGGVVRGQRPAHRQRHQHGRRVGQEHAPVARGADDGACGHRQQDDGDGGVAQIAHAAKAQHRDGHQHAAAGHQQPHLELRVAAPVRLQHARRPAQPPQGEQHHGQEPGDDPGGVAAQRPGDEDEDRRAHQAQLRALVLAQEQFDEALMDERLHHLFVVFGPCGRGLCAHFVVPPGVPCRRGRLTREEP